MFDPQVHIAQRVRAVQASGIRRVFELAGQLKDPINLSIGQPDFDVPQRIKQAAIGAIDRGVNKYTLTQGMEELHAAIAGRLGVELPNWKLRHAGGDGGLLVTSGVSGGLVLAFLACLNPGDQVIVPDPYFVMYKHLLTVAGAEAVYVDTYPDFQLTAQRVEAALTPRTKMVLLNTPSNPTGVVADQTMCRELVELAERRNLLLVSDEIYDEFCYDKSARRGSDGRAYCPSPAAFTQNLLLLRGFSKTYSMTGWRMGYAAGPAAIIEQMTKLQQYSFVCAPSMVQVAGVAALSESMDQYVEAYRRKRDLVMQKLSGTFELVKPEGAFYAFPKVPQRLGMTGTQFVEAALARNVVMIPGGVFSERDTHFRISYATSDAKLAQGLDVLVELAC